MRWAVRPTPLVLAFSAIYALCFTLIKASLRFAPPLLFAGLRILIGGVVLLALLAILAGRSCLAGELGPGLRRWPRPPR